MSNAKVSLKRKIRGAIRLLRPELPLAAGICVIVGEIIALGTIPSISKLLSGFISIFFISGSALILNDYFDFEVDKVNAPDRPLPSGAVSPREVIVLTVIATILGLAAAAGISVWALVVGIVLWIVGVLYNWRLKETGLPGNLMVCFSVAMTFIFGGIVVGDPWNKIVLTFSSMAFFVDLGEEIAADAMDMDGDKKRNSKSLAIKRGRKVALNVSAVMFVLVILISLIPICFGWLGISYVIMILIADAIILLSVVKLLKSRTPSEGHACIKHIYRGALLGLFAFLIGQLFF